MRIGVALSILAAFAFVFTPRLALAEAPSPELMARLAQHAANFETMRTHASYAIDGRMEAVDGDGHPNSVKEMKARVAADGNGALFNVLRYVEDGEDKTEEARKKAHEENTKKKEDKHDLKMPFLAGEQPRYTFNQLECDKADASRVRIAFVPKVRAEDAIEGSAWVDTRTGTVISAGFKLSKTSTFVDYVNFTVEFGAPTALGPAVSKVTVEGTGGVVFFRKRFRGTALLTDYKIIP